MIMMRMRMTITIKISLPNSLFLSVSLFLPIHLTPTPIHPTPTPSSLSCRCIQSTSVQLKIQHSTFFIFLVKQKSKKSNIKSKQLEKKAIIFFLSTNCTYQFHPTVSARTKGGHYLQVVESNVRELGRPRCRGSKAAAVSGTKKERDKIRLIYSGESR